MDNKFSAKPFLRWAGGKKWLVKHLDGIIKNLKYNKYYEPFIGGGAVYFALQPENAELSDICKPLINTYQQLQQFPEEVIEYLSEFENDKEAYYKIRSQTFLNLAQQAAQFIYLNSTSFNGIYRESRLGQYNVPYGYRTEYMIDTNRLRASSDALNNRKIIHQDFMDISSKIEHGDLVFLDPPYTVSHNKNGFIEYNQKIFKLEDQYRLSKLIDIIKEKEAYYILTNAAHPTIKGIFDKGDTIIELSRASGVGGKNAKREKISEYIFTNIE